MELTFAIVVFLWLSALSYPYLRSFLAKKQVLPPPTASSPGPPHPKPFIADDKHSWDVEQAETDNRD